MKTTLKHLTTALALLTLAAFNHQVSTARAQGTAFSYQGRLNDAGGPANGLYDLVFRLFATNTTGAAIAVPVTNSATAVTNGLFTTLIDFGPNAFTGGSNWLEIAVRTNGANSFTTLAPRQQVTPTPYALFANLANNVSGTIAAAQLPASPGFAGTVTANAFAGNGANVTNVNAAALNGLGATNFWQLGGNAVSAGQFLGSTNNQALEIRVGGARAGWISPSNGGPNITLGSAQNVISNGTAGASILGGSSNVISTAANYSMLGGGLGNSIQNSASNSVMGGGSGNMINLNSYYSVLVGGAANTIQPYVYYPFLGGGAGNSVANYAHRSALVGGENNTIGSFADHAFLGGGSGNSLGGGYSVLGGGQNNYVNGSANFLGGGSMNLMGTSVADSVLVGGTYNRIETSMMYAFLGGGSWNDIQATYAVIVGGGLNTNAAGNSFLGSGSQNTLFGPYNTYSFLGSGQGNSISNYASYSFLGGGSQNSILYNTTYSFLGGGNGNSIQANAPYSVLGGGSLNKIQAGATNSVLVGGSGNSVSNSFATVGGGSLNNASANYATVPGGANNLAGGQSSFAAGNNAQATNNGAFVWSDAEGAPFGSTTTNQFNVRANGGVRFVTGGAGMTVDGQPVLAGSNGGGLTNLNASQLTSGTMPLAQLPGNVVTNNEPLTLLNNLVLTGTLWLPTPTSITSDGTPILVTDTSANSYFGLNAGSANKGNSGSYNTGLGSQALSSDTTGHNNTAVGYQTLAASAAGRDNVAIGMEAFQNLTSGDQNAAAGAFAFQNLTAGNNNIALGYNAGNSLTAGNNNIYIGNRGQTSESGVIRIGDSGQTQTFIAGTTVGIHNNNPTATLDVGGDVRIDNHRLLLQAGTDTDNGLEYVLSGLPGVPGGAGPFLFGYNGGALGTANPNAVSLSWDFNGNVWVSNNCSVATLTIRGGADLAEPFNITTGNNEVSQGAVVVIDDQNPGHLKLSDRPYDTRVAGVVSGANGINPGIQMHQQGLMEGGKNVALSGRVYVQADASNGAIRPGDLLTTSSTPGRAMRVRDHLRAQGAILGKAMTPLSAGQGMVLVLVTLQ